MMRRTPSLKENTFYFAKWMVAAIIAMWASIPAPVITLMIFMGVDMLTGLISAYAARKLDSRVGRAGVTRKLLTLILLYVIHLLETQAHLELGLEKIAAVAYTLNEAISIIENCARSGVPIPDQLISTLKRFQKITFVRSDETGRFNVVSVQEPRAAQPKV